MKKPLIGIVGRVGTKDNGVEIISVFDTYRKAVIQAGGNPILILPPQNISYHEQKSYSNIPLLLNQEKEMLEYQLSLCDGIVSPGGYMIFNYDRFILEYTYQHNIPTLGICLGMQAMCHNFKQESLIKKEACVEHNCPDLNYCHDVLISPDSNLAKIVETKELKVNSLHSHSVKSSGIFQTIGLANDGTIEAIEDPNKQFQLGLQWHPERMITYDENAKKIWNEFIKEAKIYQERRKNNNF